MSFRPRDRHVFADTSAYFAAASRRDSHHVEASATMEVLTFQRIRLVTTNYVLAEVHGLMLARGPRDVALKTLIQIKASADTQVVRVEEQDEDRALAILTRFDDKDFSLTDATSFAVMERLGLRTAFAFDRHFVQFGWDVVPRTAPGNG